jgi:membrane-associated phospholipid phosphatase
MQAPVGRSRLVRVAFAVGAVATALVMPGTASADVVTDWNRALVDSLLTTNAAPPNSGRLAATVEGAVYDAVNGIDRRYAPLRVAAEAPGGASRGAAAVEAAYRTMSWAFPQLQADLDARRAASLGAIAAAEKEGPDSRSIQRGLTWGGAVADEYIAWRANDGFSPSPAPYIGSTAIGAWRPLPPAFTSGAFPQLGQTLPFAVAKLDDYVTPGPPELTGPRYAADLAEVLDSGGTSATAAARDIAFFWRPNSVVIWNDVARSLSDSRALKLSANARLFALLNVAMADATRAAWRQKYRYLFWRPATANEFADDDGNDATTRHDGWDVLFATPNHPDYPSGHATISAAATTALASVFGDHTPFSVTTIDPAAVAKTRTYSSFSAASDEVNDSRVYAGIHFRSAVNDGQALGRAVANAVVTSAFGRARWEPGRSGEDSFG